MTARTHVPLRSRSSSSRSASSITGYSHRLTKRDYQILIELHEHRVLITPQIYELHFDTLTRASKRMLQLYRLGLVERFRPHVPTGSAPWHYTLDEPGARLVAARQEIDFRDFPFKKAGSSTSSGARAFATESWSSKPSRCRGSRRSRERRAAPSPAQATPASRKVIRSDEGSTRTRMPCGSVQIGSVCPKSRPDTIGISSRNDSRRTTRRRVSS